MYWVCGIPFGAETGAGERTGGTREAVIWAAREGEMMGGPEGDRLEHQARSTGRKIVQHAYPLIKMIQV
jgi:hypothetical protein